MPPALALPNVRHGEGVTSYLAFAMRRTNNSKQNEKCLHTNVCTQVFTDNATAGGMSTLDVHISVVNVSTSVTGI